MVWTHARTTRFGTWDEAALFGAGQIVQRPGIDLRLNGASFLQPPFALSGTPDAAPIVVGPRIGITRAAERPRRFGWKDSPWLSRPISG